jgi:hypothetical protein
MTPLLAWLLIGIVVLVMVLAVWQTVQIQAVRRKVDAVPTDGNVFAALAATDGQLRSLAAQVVDADGRIRSLEARFPHAITGVGVVSYDAFDNIAGNQSRSIALVNERGDGLVISLLVSRVETLFFGKEIHEGTGVEPLSPEEEDALGRAMGR